MTAFSWNIVCILAVLVVEPVVMLMFIGAGLIIGSQTCLEAPAAATVVKFSVREL
jgi:hypothetical protein